MPGKTRNYKGWLLVETIYGWFIEKGGRRVRVGYSHEDFTDSLYARYRATVDEMEGRK